MLEHSEIVEIIQKSVRMMNDIVQHLNDPGEESADDKIIKRYNDILMELKWLCDKFEHNLLNDPDMQWIWKDKPNKTWLNIYDRLSFINRKLFVVL